MSKAIHFIIDFDSTFVSVESLDELATIVLKDRVDKDEIIAQIKEITALGMEGKISFEESLSRRLQLFSPHKNHLHQLIQFLKTKITRSFLKNKEFFIKNAENIYIISGGFKDFILPIVKKFGIPTDHVLANTFRFDKDGNAVGYDRLNPLSQKGGKVKAVQSLGLTGQVHVIGDGFTDYEIKAAGHAHHFYAYIEHVKRELVVSKADFLLQNFDEVVGLKR